MPIKKLFDVSSQLCISLCSFHRNLKLRPDVLAKFTKELHVEYSNSVNSHICFNDDDEFVLADGIQSIKCHFSETISAEKMAQVFPGIVIGAICRKVVEDADEYIYVEDFILPGCEVKNGHQPKAAKEHEADRDGEGYFY